MGGDTMSYMHEMANYLFQENKHNKGGTISRYGYSPTDGYMVGGVVQGETWAEPPSRQRIADFIRHNWSVVTMSTDHFIGSWVDEHGWTYLDISERFDSLELAMEVARARKEISIYDLKNHETLYLEGGTAHAD
jgi:hypothetical protein